MMFYLLGVQFACLYKTRSNNIVLLTYCVFYFFGIFRLLMTVKKHSAGDF